MSHEDLTVRALDEAERLVREGGRQALSMRLIARAAACASGTLYNVIGDLDDIILAVNARTTDAWADRLEAAADSAEDTIGRIRAMAHAYIAAGEENPRLWSLLFEYQLPEGAELPEWYRAVLARPISHVHNTVRPALDSDRAAADFVARIWTALHGVVSLSITDKLSILIQVPSHDFVDGLVDMHLRAAGLGDTPSGA
ncbi:MAG: TetR/AcrR family transcriptional regulator [Pseudomonadota bacterium]